MNEVFLDLLAIASGGPDPDAGIAELLICSWLNRSKPIETTNQCLRRLGFSKAEIACLSKCSSKVEEDEVDYDFDPIHTEKTVVQV